MNSYITTCVNYEWMQVKFWSDRKSFEGVYTNCVPSITIVFLRSNYKLMNTLDME